MTYRDLKDKLEGFSEKELNCQVKMIFEDINIEINSVQRIFNGRRKVCPYQYSLMGVEVVAPYGRNNSDDYDDPDDYLDLENTYDDE